MKTRIYLFGVLILLVAITWCLQASGKTIIVDQSGEGDFTTISDAVVNASDGDIIFVKSGVYQENVVLDKNVSIVGEGKEITILEAAVTGHTLKLYKLHDCTISNVTIRGAKGTGNDNIYLDECNNITIRYCSIEGSESSDGITLYRCSFVSITNCAITNNKQGNGVFLIYSSNCLITDNNISGNQVGIFLQYQSCNNTIARNIIKENVYIGVRISASGTPLYSPSDNIIYENTFKLNGQNAEDTTDSLNMWCNPETKRGNYWDDYQGEDTDHDGIGDTPYPIPGGNNQDMYVLGFFQGSSSPQNEKPIANAGGDYSGKVNTPIHFDASKSYDPDGSIVSYKWDFGDGSTGEGKKVYHVYTEPGDYIVTLTVTDNDGAEAKDVVTVHVFETIENQKPIPVIEVKDQARVGEVLVFNASKSYDPDGSIVSYTWRFGDGKIDHGKVVFHSYSVPGTYVVELEIVDNEGFKNTTSKVIVVSAPAGGGDIKAHLKVEPSTALINSKVIFNASHSEGEIVTYIWEFGDGSNATTTSPICNHTYAKPGTYYVNLTVIGANGETDKTSTIVVVKESWKKSTPDFTVLVTITSIVVAFLVRRRA